MLQSHILFFVNGHNEKLKPDDFMIMIIINND